MMQVQRRKTTSLGLVSSIALVTALTTISSGCHGSRKGGQLEIVPLQESKLTADTAKRLTLDDLRRMAPTTFKGDDPDICPSTAVPDTHEKSDPGLTTHAYYEFPKKTNVTDLYVRTWILVDKCTKDSLSSADRSVLDSILSALRITKAKSFAETISIADESLSVKYPNLVPFSYAFDQDKGTYAIQTMTTVILPWQTTAVLKVDSQYVASQNISVNTAELFNSVATDIAGAGSATSVLSANANAYLSAANTLAQSVSSSIYNAQNQVKNQYAIDMAHPIPSQTTNPVRMLTIRLHDMHNKPLAGVRIAVTFIRSIAKSEENIDPTTDAATQAPQFTGIPDILAAKVGGPTTGSQTLLDAISKEKSYQALLKTDDNTDPKIFRDTCNTLEGALNSTYGLNRYDVALTMGEILGNNTDYLHSSKLYSSGCFRGRGDLKLMGILTFDTAPRP